ncbi:MAG: hypothetical protein H5T73_00835 [Actinobacteria bacterium]|nr:hypothetical protein [Actinomycetota bacterium]
MIANQSPHTNDANHFKPARRKHEEDVCKAVTKVLGCIRNKEYILEGRPDMIERNKKAVDCIFRCGKERIALEHTILENYSCQIKNDKQFEKLTSPLLEQLKPEMPPGRFTIIFHPDDIEKKRKPELEPYRESLRVWIIQKAKELSEENTSRTRGGTICDYPDRIPFKVTIRYRPYEIQKVLFARFMPESIDAKSRKRLKVALEEKCPKLASEKEKGAISVLVLEMNDFVLGDRDEVAKMLGKEVSQTKANTTKYPVPDYIFLVETFDNDEWQVSLLIEDGELADIRDRYFLIDPTTGNITGQWF